VISAELDAALDACAEHERLSRQLDRARLEESRARLDVDRANAVVGEEARDVEALESMSPARIWAAIRGTRTSELDRERAELAAEQYRAAAALRTLESATALRQRLEADVDALGDVRDRRARAIATEEARLRATGGSVGAQLLEVSEQLASTQAQLREVHQAKAAERGARTSLEAAAELLGAASDWAVFDTLFGGGMLTGMVKYEKIDAATARVQAANEALKRLSAELADVGLRAVGGVDVSEFDRTLDLWFDNIFTDWTVQQRVTEAAERVQAALRAVDGVADRLRGRELELDSLLATLTQAREQLIIGR
jgi:hypothetical protein